MRAAAVPLSVVELMDRKHRHMKHKDSEEMLSGVTLFGGLLSHSHSDERKEQKEVENEMRILQVLRK